MDQQVIIVGAGPSGLALAIELGLRGIKCLVIERKERVGLAPRAKTTNVRTRTHLRRWGIADRLAAASPFGVHYPTNIHFVTRLAGSRLALIENASNCAPNRHSDYPEHGQWVPQYKLEEVLRERAATLPGVVLRFNTELLAAAQTSEHVMVTLRSRSGVTESHVPALYLIGADGAHSTVRELIGATMIGQDRLSRNYNIVFRAPGLREAHHHGPGSMYWQVNPMAPSLLGPMDKDDVWYFMPTRLPEGFEITKESAAALIRDATGIDLPYEILSSDEWIASSLLADRYRDGRIFLIGDACHLHPPFGGYGMNMGISDGVDLGWKLAAVCGGWGGPGLLDSYPIERRAIHEAVLAEAAMNHAALSNDFLLADLETPGAAGEAVRQKVGERIREIKTREFHTLGTVLGGCYERSPIIEEDGTPVPLHDSMHYVPCSRPGCLAPHVWRSDGRSLYDDFGSGFTMVSTPEAQVNELDCARDEFALLRVPLSFVSLAPAEAVTRYPAPFTLIRPDQHVAWRGARWPVGLARKVTGWPPTAARGSD